MPNSIAPVPRTRSPARRLIRAIAKYAGVPYFGVVVLMAVFQRLLIYGPAHDASLNVHPTIIQGARNEPISLTTPDHLELNGWHITAGGGANAADEKGGEWSQGRPLILYFCGNAGNRSYRADVFDFLAELGADLFASITAALATTPAARAKPHSPTMPARSGVT
jgi:hypothetical protein